MTIRVTGTDTVGELVAGVGSRLVLKLPEWVNDSNAIMVSPSRCEYVEGSEDAEQAELERDTIAFARTLEEEGMG